MATRTALSMAEQQYLLSRKHAGASLRTIAAELQCARATVRKHWRRLSKGAVPPPRGRPARGVLSTFPPALIACAVELKRAHPHWGPAAIRLELAAQPTWAAQPLPSLTRLSALFRQRCPEAVQPRKRTVYPQPAPQRPTAPHQRWQMDAKEQVALQTGEAATVLSLRDPVAALMLHSRAILTQRAQQRRRLTRAEVQETLRDAFERYGLPLEVQSDHEAVYTGAPQADYPSPFTLWLVGLGMQHLTSREHRPTDQAQIERSHRTHGGLLWLDAPPESVASLQQQLTLWDQRYNQFWPVHAAHCQGRPPLTVHPSAAYSGRPYRRTLEWCLFHLEWVDAYLAARVWTRQVNASGHVSLGDHLYLVSRAHAHQRVSVCFEPATRTLKFATLAGECLAHLPLVGASQADLIGYPQPTRLREAPWQLPLPLRGV